MRIVLDTNVLISSLISSKGSPRQLLDRWENGEFTLVTSNEQKEELRRVLGRKHIQKLMKKEEAVEFVKLLDGAAEFVKNLPTVDLSPDPKDNFILAMAIAGKADLLVSGDKKHVHALKQVGGTMIVSPTRAVQRLQENDTAKKTNPSDSPYPQGPR